MLYASPKGLIESIAVWKQVVANLKEYMPEGIRINQITAGHAKEFHEKLKARGMATTTIHKRIQFARQFMHDAVDWKIIDENPFLKVKTQKSSVKVNEFVPREVVNKLMKKANPVWKVILGLSRYGGLRTPSETLSLRWEDIDWEMNRMSIPEPKVEHHEGRGIRSCPIFPELRSILDEAFEINDYDEDDEDGGDDDDASEDAVLFIVEGQQLGYGTKRAWEVARNN
jgi:integrase